MDTKISITKILSLIVILLLVFTALLISLSNVNPLLLLLSSMVLTFYVCIGLFSSDMMNPFMMLLLTTGLGTLDVVVVSLGLRDVNFGVEEKYYILSLIIINLWHLLFVVGYFISNTTKGGSQSTSPACIQKDLFNDKIVFIIILVVVIIGAYLIFRVAGSYGGIILAMQARGDAYEGLGFLSMLLGLGGILPVLLLRKQKNILAGIMLLIIFFLNATLGGRTSAIYVSVLPTLFYYNYHVKRINKKSILLITIPIAIFIVFWGQLRMYDAIDLNIDVSDFLTSLTSNKNFGQNLPYMMYAIDNREIPFQFLNFAFNAIFAFIPRGIWPDKPDIDESGIIGRLLYGATSTGQPVGQYGFAYLCFSWIGVVLFGFTTGYIVAKISNTVKNINRYEVWLWYSYIIVLIFSIWLPSPQFRIIWYTMWFLSFTILSKFFLNR